MSTQNRDLQADMRQVLEVLLTARGRDRRWLAEEIGVSLSRVHSWFAHGQAQRRISVEDVPALAAALEVSIETLYRPAADLIPSVPWAPPDPTPPATDHRRRQSSQPADWGMAA